MSTITFAPPLKTINGIKPLRDDVPAADCLCDYCTARCCRYFALPVETPTEHADFDFIRWYLLHDKASMFVEDDTWYLLVHTVCKHLQSDNRCGIYQTRPQICRDYTTARCEYDDDAVYDMYFETPEQVAQYMEALFVTTDPASIRSPEPALLPMLNG